MTKEEELRLEDVLNNFHANIILSTMGYDEDLCFASETELEVYLNNTKRYRYMNEQDVYDRVRNLIDKNKLTYSQWDEFLKQHE